MDRDFVHRQIEQIEFEIIPSSEVVPRCRIARINNSNHEPLVIQTPPINLNQPSRTISSRLLAQVLDEDIGPTYREIVLERLRILSQQRRHNRADTMARRAGFLISEGQSASNYSELGQSGHSESISNFQNLRRNGVFAQVINYNKYLLAISNNELVKDNLINKLTCSICLEQINSKSLTSSDNSDEIEESDKISQLSCKHIFHTNCIKNWIKINLSCPYCREICKVISGDKLSSDKKESDKKSILKCIMFNTL